MVCALGRRESANGPPLTKILRTTRSRTRSRRTFPPGPPNGVPMLDHLLVEEVPLGIECGDEREPHVLHQGVAVRGVDPHGHPGEGISEGEGAVVLTTGSGWNASRPAASTCTTLPFASLVKVLTTWLTS